MEDQRSYTVTDLYEMASDLDALKKAAKDIQGSLDHLEEVEEPPKYVHWTWLGRTICVPRGVFVDALKLFEDAVAKEVERLKAEFDTIGIEPDVGEPDDDD